MSDADFALARLATVGTFDARVQRVLDDVAIGRRIASHIRSALLQHTIVRADATQISHRCTFECRDACEHYTVRVFVGNDDDTEDDGVWRVKMDGVWVHACVEHDNACRECDLRTHQREWTTRARENNVTLARTLTEGGGVHWCVRHLRLHVCVAHCDQSFVDALGFRVCVLSGRMVGSSMRQQYGDGTRATTTIVAEQRRDAVRIERHNDTTLRRSAMHAVERVVRAGDTHVHERSPSMPAKKRTRKIACPETATKNVRKLLDDVNDDNINANEERDEIYVDLDAPSEDLFGDTFVENTFADGVGSMMVRLYAQSYASVYLLLFSDARARYEQGVRRQVLNEATTRLNSYFMSKRKPGTFVSLPVARRIELRALNARRHLPVLLVPEHAPERMTAYYSMVIVEFYVQLLRVVKRLQSSMNASSRTIVDRFAAASLASVAPNVLDLMHEGLSVDSKIIIGTEAMLTMFPDVPTMQAIGIDARRCTETKKMIKHLVLLVTQSNVPINDLATTRVDSMRVFFDTGSVVSIFLAERRRRLGLDVDDDDNDDDIE